MKKTNTNSSHSRFALLIALAVATLLPLSASAQGRDGLGRLADAASYFRDAECVMSGGEITEVQQWNYSNDPSSPAYGTVLKIRSNEGEFLAYMGPSRYFENRSYEFLPGEVISLKGAMGLLNGEKVLIARKFADLDGFYVVRNIDGSMDFTTDGFTAVLRQDLFEDNQASLVCSLMTVGSLAR